MKNEASAWGYALLCVVAPTLWGLFIVWGMQKVEQRRSTARGREQTLQHPEPDTFVPDYHI